MEQTGDLQFEVPAVPLCQVIRAHGAMRNQNCGHVTSNWFFNRRPSVEKPLNILHCASHWRHEV